jgi:hypothetical protein
LLLGRSHLIANTMEEKTSVKSLVKILIGAAWLDGKIQPEEREHLYKVAQEKGVANDPDIKPLLHGLKPVQPSECYEWVNDYLGERPSAENCQRLLEAISGSIYADGEVAVEEAKLLSKLQSLNLANEATQPSHNAVLKQIQKLYRRWVVSQS